MEVPAIISNFMLCFARVLYTPHSYAPREPPPCSTRTDSTGKPLSLTSSLLLIFIWLYVDVSSICLLKKSLDNWICLRSISQYQLVLMSYIIIRKLCPCLFPVLDWVSKDRNIISNLPDVVWQ